MLEPQLQQRAASIDELSSNAKALQHALRRTDLLRVQSKVDAQAVWDAGRFRGNDQFLALVRDALGSANVLGVTHVDGNAQAIVHISPAISLPDGGATPLCFLTFVAVQVDEDCEGEGRGTTVVTTVITQLRSCVNCPLVVLVQAANTTLRFWKHPPLSSNTEPTWLRRIRQHPLSDLGPRSLFCNLPSCQWLEIQQEERSAEVATREAFGPRAEAFAPIAEGGTAEGGGGEGGGGEGGGEGGGGEGGGDGGGGEGGSEGGGGKGGGGEGGGGEDTDAEAQRQQRISELRTDLGTWFTPNLQMKLQLGHELDMLGGSHVHVKHMRIVQTVGNVFCSYLSVTQPPSHCLLTSYPPPPPPRASMHVTGGRRILLAESRHRFHGHGRDAHHGA